MLHEKDDRPYPSGRPPRTGDNITWKRTDESWDKGNVTGVAWWDPNVLFVKSDMDYSYAVIMPGPDAWETYGRKSKREAMK